MNKYNLPWTQKYCPKNLKDVKIDPSTLNKLKNTILAKKTIFIHGPVGCGKTCIPIALANELNYEILEVNASDVRNKDHINQIVGNSLKQMSLFHKGKIILVDEVDGIAGNKDRGGVQALVKLIEEAKQPIILTANDPWSSKFTSLRKKSEMIELKEVDCNSILDVLKEICLKEKINYEECVLKSIARRSAGDLRSAINDLQQIAEGKDSIKNSDLEVLGDREKEETIFNALRLIFKSKRVNDVLTAFDNVNIDLNEACLWLDENLPKEYIGEDLLNAYHSLSKANVFKGRIMRWQHWRFLVYMNALMTVGVALAKKEKKSGFVNYQRTTRLLKLWIANRRKAKIKALCDKIGEGIQGSSSRIMKETLPYIKIMLKNNKEIDFGLDKEEIMYLTK